MVFRLFILMGMTVLVFFVSFFYSSKHDISVDKGTISRIRVVGSSTVFPFSSIAAEYFGKKTKYLTPIIEATGTGGGMMAFCSSNGVDAPDMVNASRKMKESERVLCMKNNVINIFEIPLGYDGLVIAGSRQAKSKPFNLTKKQIFLALAPQVPLEGKLVKNPYKKWNEISKDLPDKVIKFLGPPPTSGTRDSFVEMVLEKGCAQIEGAKDLGLHKKSCHAIREDGPWQDMGENDNLIVQKVNADHENIGIFGYAYYEENKNVLKAAKIENILPSFENIKNNKYSVSRPLFVYLKKDNIKEKSFLRDFALELLSEDAAGEYGYLAQRGLVPIDKETRRHLRSGI